MRRSGARRKENSGRKNWLRRKANAKIVVTRARRMRVRLGRGRNAFAILPNAWRVPPLFFVILTECARPEPESLVRSFLRLRIMFNRISANSRSSSSCNRESSSSFRKISRFGSSCATRSESSVGGGEGIGILSGTTREARFFAVISRGECAGGQEVEFRVDAISRRRKVRESMMEWTLQCSDKKATKN